MTITPSQPGWPRPNETSLYKCRGGSLARELVVTVPLVQDKGLNGEGKLKVRRFRSRLLELGTRLRELRVEHGLTQSEVARTVGVGHTSICQWEAGEAVPDGLARDRLVDLLQGRLWRRLREALVDGEGMPGRWNGGVRWYRRASRQRPLRERIGVVLAAALERLQEIDSLDGLRERYCGDDGRALGTLLVDLVPHALPRNDAQRTEDAAFGLRWLELACEFRFDLTRSLTGQIPLPLLDQVVEKLARGPRFSAVRRDR